MHQTLPPDALAPYGFEVASAVCDGVTAVITVRHISKANPCPGCGARSERVHSRYLRRLSDLPLAGRSVRLVGQAEKVDAGSLRRIPSART